MQIGNGTYGIKGNELLFVPAGRVFSFRTGDVNEGGAVFAAIFCKQDQ